MNKLIGLLLLLFGTVLVLNEDELAPWAGVNWNSMPAPSGEPPIIGPGGTPPAGVNWNS